MKTTRARIINAVECGLIVTATFLVMAGEPTWFKAGLSALAGTIFAVAWGAYPIIRRP